jgi:hypothetical protein
MATDYAAIKANNVIRYGTDIGRIGPMLLADRYDERTHFIFELLQNAEDALARRESKAGPRSVVFKLGKASLTVSHFGQPFSRADVAGICGIAEGTKAEDLTAIGRFGIGFKAVYAFTDAPEIHSSTEHFAIDSFVWPRQIPPVTTRPNETLFILPFRHSDATAFDDIAEGLQGLGTRTMLFLREIEEISWSVEGAESGTYLREQPRILTEDVREVLLVGQEKGSKEVASESWLVFSRGVQGPDNRFRGFVELAFSLESKAPQGQQMIQRAEDGALAVFFPTILTTHVGFLIQGPYRTTPSRDNVPRDDSWNAFLVKETASLLVNALLHLKSAGLLTVEALRTLPIDRSKFRADSLFEPIFVAAKEALSTLKLLPAFGGTYVAARSARLARTQALRELLTPAQVGQLFGQAEAVFWLSEEITADRAPELRQYLITELQIGEIEPSAIVSKLSRTFLEAQTDEWIAELYGFLLQQPSLWKSSEFRSVPIVRLENGDQVVAWRDKQPQAFLPGDIVTGFPTVRRSICQSRVARDFLKELGLSKPDPVDDVVVNLLPKYRQSGAIGDDEYKNDVERILQAYNTDSKVQREKLIVALRKTPFVAALTLAGTNEVSGFEYPERVYLATQRLKDLFSNVPNVFLVDDTRECLRGENVREMLEACGVSRSLLALEAKPAFSYAELTEMRRTRGETGITYQIALDDFTISGLTELFGIWPTLASDEQAKRSALLWDALCELESRRGTSVFWGTYRWFYFRERSHSFAAAFVRTLNETRWVPSPDGTFERPSDVVFDTIAPPWKASSFILSVIPFKPPVLAALAREAGFELGLIDLLMKLGLTKESDLLSRLNMAPTAPIKSSPDPAPSATAVQEIPIEAGLTEPEAAGGTEMDLARPLINSAENNRSTANSTGGIPGARHEPVEGPSKDKRAVPFARSFISYVAMNPLVESDLDGLTHDERTALEEAAIELILKDEPALERTSTNNPGFDLVEMSGTGRPIRWVEVKAMKQTLRDRPVGLSKPQFTLATLREDAFWLYIVERAGDKSEARIIRIQNPAGKAQTFTFDQGWLNVAHPPG